MNIINGNDVREVKHLAVFCGGGFGAKGMNRSGARVGSMVAKFRCIGGIDSDSAAIKDFEVQAGVKGTCMDLFSRDQYIAFHGNEPPAGWKEATVSDIHRAAGHERPHIVFLSAPCKGFTGLISTEKSLTNKYQALNELTLRGLWLVLEAFKDDPPDFFLFENVPRIMTRGRHLLDQISALLRVYGYAVAETTHDCGELGGMAQSRRRFLMVARHQEKVPPFLYEPPKRPLRPVGDLLDRMPLPGDPKAGPMHRVPRLQWQTWVRLAFVEAGSDWKSLNRLAVEEGVLRDYMIIPQRRTGYLGVNAWDKPVTTVAGRSGPTNGNFSVADPRFNQSTRWNSGQAYGVRKWSESRGTVTGQQSPGQGNFSIADPRGQCFAGKYKVTPYGGHTSTVISGSTTGQGAFAVADPRKGLLSLAEDGGIEGEWLPAARDKLVAYIESLDRTWHRPFTTLELAVLQSIVEPEESLILFGNSDEKIRERIGNAVPPVAAEAIGSMIGKTLLLAWSGETFVLGSTPIWVRGLAIGLTVDTRNIAQFV